MQILKTIVNRVLSDPKKYKSDNSRDYWGHSMHLFFQSIKLEIFYRNIVERVLHNEVVLKVLAILIFNCSYRD